MKIIKFTDMKGGWFVGNFEPTAYKTDQFEVSYKIHPQGEQWGLHYHEVVKEINLLMHGKMKIQGKELNAGDIFIIEPYEIADPEFIEDCHIICVKTPSVNDKIVVKK